MYGLTLNLFMEVGKWFVCLNIPIIIILFVLKNPVLLLKMFLRCRIFQLGFYKREITTRKDQLVSYIERGKPSCKPSYLFVHGYSNSKEIFLDVIAWLPRSAHVIVVDLPGHGDTPFNENDDISIMYLTEHLHQFVNAVGLSKQKFCLIGESMGGHVAGIYSALHPQYVQSTTLMCPHGIKTGSNIEKMKANYENTGRCVLLPQDLKGVREMFENVLCKTFPFPNFVLNGILQMRLERDDFNRKLLRRLVTADDEDLLERSLKDIKTPVLLIWGEKDQILDVRCAEKIRSDVKNLKKTVILENVGHLLSVDCPKQVALNIHEFTGSY